MGYHRFGLGDYKNKGLFLFTIRNGSPANLKTCTGKVYAEKLLIVDDHQITPYHFHWQKVEDIINRGGGRLLIKLYNSTPTEDADRVSAVTVSLDGVETKLPAGGVVTLQPGESITLPTGLFHQFWAEGGRVLVGEVSTVNDDDDTDNKFLEPIGRFTANRGRRAALPSAGDGLRDPPRACPLIHSCRGAAGCALKAQSN